jgi:hypothetical protein
MTLVDMQRADIPVNVAALIRHCIGAILVSLGCTVHVEVIEKHVENVGLPCIVIPIAEDYVIRPHLDDGMKLVVTNEILHRIGAHEVRHSILAIVTPYPWSSVDHNSSPRIRLPVKLVPDVVVLSAIIFIPDAPAVVGIDLAVFVSNLLPDFRCAAGNVLHIQRTRLVPFELPADVVIIDRTEDSLLVSNEIGIDKLDGLYTCLVGDEVALEQLNNEMTPNVGYVSENHISECLVQSGLC